MVQIRLQLFKWGHFHIFSLSYNLTSDDLWPWYMTFDLINKWGFPFCIYDPFLVEIHQSMWKIEPNVNPFFHNRQQQQTKGDKGIPKCLSCRQHKNKIFNQHTHISQRDRKRKKQNWEMYYTKQNKTFWTYIIELIFLLILIYLWFTFFVVLCATELQQLYLIHFKHTSQRTKKKKKKKAESLNKYFSSLRKIIT